MEKRFVLWMAVFSVFLGVSSVALAQLTNITALTLHDSLGQVIDAQENVRYNIFGEILGFTAAKFYIDENKFLLHILRNAEGRSQILILNLDRTSFTLLRSNLLSRINAALKEDVRFDRALYAIEETKWRERSRNKRLVLRDGSELLVNLIGAQNDTLVVQTLGGLQIPVPDNNIAKVIDLQGETREGKRLRVDPNTSRLFFAPTGHRLEAGKGYFADYFIFFPTLAYGVTDFFSLSGGVSIVPGAESQLLYFAPKLTLQISPRVGFSTGFLYLAIPDEEDDLNLGYAVTTFGTKRSGITLGAGLPLTSDSDQKPILLIGGEAQVSNNAKLITENWIFTGGDATIVFSGGIRFFGDRLAVDLAFISFEELFEGGGFPFLPWVDFSVFFGK